MSSAILYLAIVAIWAVVLVPRWLRSRPAPPVPVPAEQEAGRREPDGPGQDAGPELSVSAEELGTAGELAVGERVAGPDAETATVAEKADEPEAGEAGAPVPGTRRSEMLRARRRLLTALAGLTAIAMALVVTRIGGYWIVIPPTVLLAGYLLLLRQFAHIDAERAPRTGVLAQAGPESAVSREPAPVARSAASEPGPGSLPDTPGPPVGAEIIDISGRIGDQVYDQYADAANRAVGD